MPRCGRVMSIRHYSKQLRRVTHCIFDLEGTLLNNIVQFESMLDEICELHGKTCPLELKNQLYGATDNFICHSIISHLKIPASVMELESQLTQMGSNRLPRAPLHRGAERLVRHLKEHEIPLALVTNSTRKIVSQLINDRKEFFKQFQHLVAVDDVNYRGKPDPDIYLLAAKKFDTPVYHPQCLVFEDSTPGLRAAVAAEMRVVLTPHKNIIDKRYITPLTDIIPDLLHFKPEQYDLPGFDEVPPNRPPPTLRTIENDNPSPNIRYTK